MERWRRLIVEGLLWTGSAADRVARLSHYLAAGTLRLADLQDGIRDAWQDHYSRESDIPPVFMPWEQELVERFVPPGAGVLLIGCGSGRDVIALVARGCRVTGVEPSERALGRARRALLEQGLSADLVEGFFEDSPLSGRFDAIVFSYYCYASMPQSQRRVTALRKAAAQLSSGGHIIVSHACAVRPHLIFVRIARLAGVLSRSDWRVEPGDLLWANRGARPSYSYAHAFAPGEVEREAAAAGLRPVFSRESGDGRAVALAPK